MRLKVAYVEKTPVRAIVAAGLSALDLMADIDHPFLKISNRARPVEVINLMDGSSISTLPSKIMIPTVKNPARKGTKRLHVILVRRRQGWH